jgi:hypothetical protein
MCMTGFCMTDPGVTAAGVADSDGLTLAVLLQDPLTRMMMLSDGVTEKHFSDLMLRVQGCLIARAAMSAGREHGVSGTAVG